MELFNPYEHLKASTDEDNRFIFEYLEANGLPVHRIGPDGKLHRVLVVKRYLPTSAWRSWFYSRFADGAMEVEDLTPNPVVADGKFVDYPSYRIKVSLYADREKNKFIASGYGVYSKTKKYNPREEYSYVEKSESYNNYLIAQANAIKNAMANAGFIFDMNEDILNGEEAQYLEYIQFEDRPSEEIPVTMEEAGSVEVTETEAPKPAPSSAAKEKAAVKAETKPEEKIEELDIVSAFHAARMEEAEKKEANSEPEESEETVDGGIVTDPESVIFTPLEGVELPPLMKELVGKEIGSLDKNDISYFARKDMSKLLTQETIDAIAAVA